MLPGKKLFMFIFYLLIPLVIPAKAAKSVYVISDTLISQLKAYKVDGTNLIYQNDYVCVSDPPTTAGAIVLAIDESEYGQFLFVTFEDSDEIELVNAKTMKYVDVVTAQGADDMAGVAMDADSEILFELTSFSVIIKYNKVGTAKKI